jgi:hypothetical protein
LPIDASYPDRASWGARATLGDADALAPLDVVVVELSAADFSVELHAVTTHKDASSAKPPLPQANLVTKEHPARH